MSEKFAWILNPLSSWDETKEMITTSLESGIDHIVNFSSENNENIRKLGNINIVSNSEDSDIYLVGISSEGDGTLELDENLDKSKDLAEAKKFRNLNKPVCAYIEITDKNHEQLAVKLGDYCDYLILVGKDWTVIPLENIIADLQTKDVKLIAAVESVEDAKVAIETLEVGTDGVIFEPKDFNQIKEISKLIENLSQETYSLKDATVTNVTPLGSGDRVCIDTTAIMEPGEGMLIGSYSKAMIFIHSESLESEYVASRPFRVNAGPVQAYVMVPGGKTRYLSELEVGDEVLIVNTDGETRKAYVGRSKIEKRPLLLIEAEYEDVKIKTLVQNAETIRVVDNEGKPLSVADLKKGDKIKVFIDQKARHFGMSIDENIIEK
ncbi:MAG: 3-dehydroquinate synthase II [Methanobrevibacter sp.]